MIVKAELIHERPNKVRGKSNHNPIVQKTVIDLIYEIYCQMLAIYIRIYVTISYCNNIDSHPIYTCYDVCNGRRHNKYVSGEYSIYSRRIEGGIQ